jgi:MFS family permease
VQCRGSGFERDYNFSTFFRGLPRLVVDMCIPDSSSKAAAVRRLKATNWGVTLGSISVFVSLLGGSMTIPFLQSQRDSLSCDALCYGTMQSLRSGLTLVGSVFVGRLSDRLGRKVCLYIGLAASVLQYSISVNFNSLDGMRMAMVPSSLLNQNFNVLKALFADYNSGGVESERASALGRLGMAVGVSFMIGPVIGTTFLSNYRQANLAALCLTLVAGVFLYLLPEPEIKRSPSQQSLEADIEDSLKKEKGGILSFLYLPAAQTPGARLLFFMRCGMALAFNIFMTIWTVSLKERFNFAPRDHAFFMGWVRLSGSCRRTLCSIHFSPCFYTVFSRMFL